MHKIVPFIIQVLAMDLSEKDSIQYLSDNGFKISTRYLYILKNKVKRERNNRLTLIAKSEFRDQHIQRIEQLETIQKEYWKLYRQESKPINKAQILSKLVELQTYVSTYYDSSRYVMEQSIIQDPRKKRKKIVESEQQEEIGVL